MSSSHIPTTKNASLSREASESGDSEPGEGTAFAWWLVLAGLSSWSYIEVWANNSEELVGFQFDHFALWTLSFLVVGFAVQRTTLLCLSGPRRRAQSFAAAATALIFLQSWNTDLTTGMSLPARIALWLGLTALVGAIAIRLAATFPFIRPVIGVLTVFLVGSHYITAAGEAWNGVTAEPIAAAVATAGGSALGSDIYVVVLDEYTSGRVLATEFTGDNTSFEASLAASGVSVVPGAKSNYTSTQLSVAGLLDGSFPAVGSAADRSFEALAEIHSGNNRLFASLGAAGYETHMFDNAWTFTRCGRHVDVCHETFTDELDYLVAARTPLVDLLPVFQRYPWITGSLDQFEEAIDLVRTPSDQPRLVYLHALIPHAPLQLEPDCTFSLPGTGGIAGVQDTPQARSAYVRQVGCVNSLLIEFVQAAPSDAIILLAGDHGVRWAGSDPAVDENASPSDVAIAFEILTAYRFPDACIRPSDGASLMETTNRLFSCLEIEVDAGQRYAAEDSRRFFGSSPSGEVIDITKAIVRAED